MEITSQNLQASGLRRYYLRISAVIILLLIGSFIYLNDPPSTFPADSIFTVKQGDTLNSISKDLKSKKIIRSTILFRTVVTLFAGEQKLVAGDYYFAHPTSIANVASRFVGGSFEILPVKITIPEGSSMSEMSKIFSLKFPHFSEKEFMKYSAEKEGYLFPDTYIFAPDVDAEQIILSMQNNFNEKIKNFANDINVSGKTEKEIIAMASILEKEARTQKDWQIISGILWKRIKIGMPLQVDSSLWYVTGKASSDLTLADLKMNSLYNSYNHKGLPPTAICSPGLETIKATLTPIKTPYLYYLSDKNGDIHYAATFADHIKNKQKYLN